MKIIIAITIIVSIVALLNRKSLTLLIRKISLKILFAFIIILAVFLLTKYYSLHVNNQEPIFFQN